MRANTSALTSTIAPISANRLIITQENFLIIEGKLQKSQGVISVLARKFEALPSALHDRNLSHDFH